MEKSPDRKALDTLASSGSDLSKLHLVDFTLRFPAQKAAENAQLRMETLAFETKLARTADAWVIQGTKRMYPVESDLIGLRDKLNVIAADGKGVYEGWHARVVNSK